MKWKSQQGGANLHQLDLHGHADGAEHPDGVRLPEDQGVLQGEARTWVPGGQHAKNNLFKEMYRKIEL